MGLNGNSCEEFFFPLIVYFIVNIINSVRLRAILAHERQFVGALTVKQWISHVVYGARVRWTGGRPGRGDSAGRDRTVDRNSDVMTSAIGPGPVVIPLGGCN